MNAPTLSQSVPDDNLPRKREGQGHRWLPNIGEITRECEKHGLDVSKRQCRHLLETGQLPGTRWPGSPTWRSRTDWIADRLNPQIAY